MKDFWIFELKRHTPQKNILRAMKILVVILLGFPINSYATKFATQSINYTL